MKQILATLLAAAVCSGAAFGGHPKAKGPLYTTGGEPATVNARGPIVLPPIPYSLGPGDSIGFTVYDYGTNGSTCENLINYRDGVFSSARMASELVDGAVWADRGSWYTCSTDGGVTWAPRTKMETTRHGWASMAQIADANGTEVVASHVAFEVNVDADRCLNTWIPYTPSTTAIWPRIDVGSGFTFHLVHADANPPTAVWYSRSTDAGTTWELDRPIFTDPGVSADADGYNIDATGNRVAIVSAGASGDVVLNESTDGGATFTQSVVYNIDNALLTAGEEPPDGSCDIIYDNSDNVHVVWGSYFSNGTGSNFDGIEAGIRHWSVATGVQEIALPTQDSTMPTPFGRDGNYASKPDIGIDSLGNLYVAYSSTISEVDALGNNYEHVFALMSTDGGATWTTPVDITPGTGFDASFPSLADDVDDYLHIIYNSDPLAGNNVQNAGTHPQDSIAVMYLRVPVTSLVTSVRQRAGLPDRFALEQNYPNPFNPTTNIRYSIPKSSFVTLKVYDILGKEVATLVDGEQTAGSYVADFDAASLANGVYLYRLHTDNFSSVRKMIVLK